MKSTLKLAASFIFGAALGGAIAWYATKKFYDDHMQEQIDSVKEAYANKQPEEKEPVEEKTDNVEWPKADTSEWYSPSILDKREHIKIDYSSIAKPYSSVELVDKGEDENDSYDLEEEEEDTMGETLLPYPIAETEFADIEGFSTMTLIYYTDDILADINDNQIVYNEDEILGNSWKHAFDIGEDVSYIRNRGRHCDYEILRSELSYTEDVLPGEPPTLEGLDGVQE